MGFLRGIKRAFTSVNLRQVYVAVGRPYSFQFLIKFDHADDKKFVVFRLCQYGMTESQCHLSVEEFNDFVDGVLKTKAELEKPLPASLARP
ncbi:hypothetical protein EB235_01025 [Mesorhizobium loti R88b]|uniref:DUF3276 family protein n=1 Tax=Mesorhizobium loti R88b TaxID=935548 RepID=A0A6M7WE64_RHILI|nr:hypothetical protein EB235_01025 [Mesorhizobium loti R88b]